MKAIQFVRKVTGQTRSQIKPRALSIAGRLRADSRANKIATDALAWASAADAAFQKQGR